MINIEHLLFFSFALFGIGLAGIVMRRNLMFVLLSLELMFNAVAVLFVGASSINGNADGHVMYILILTLAASEVAIALGLAIHMFRHFHTLDVDQLSTLGDTNG
jgi:NADH-quinone oxidoreductase subunit K